VKLPRRHTKRGRVEIIPMIDTILILLIFYMTFSTFTQKEKRMDAKMPTLSTRVAPTAVSLDIVLHVRNEKEIIVGGGATYDIESLRDAMMSLATIGQQATVVIEAEPDTRYQDVIAALDACAQAGLTKVAFRPLEERLASAQ
jgi:biopolymer transport protein ExbD